MMTKWQGITEQGSTRSLGKRNMFGLESLLMERAMGTLEKKLIFAALARYDLIVL